MTSDIIYLASPYSDPDPAVREARFHAVCREAALMTHNGLAVFSPIAHSHNIALHGLPLDWEYWKRVDHSFLALSASVVVLMLDGWRESTGVIAEIKWADELRKPVTYRQPIAE